MYMGEYCFYICFLIFIILLSLLGIFSSTNTININNYNKKNNVLPKLQSNTSGLLASQYSKELYCPVNY